MGGNMTVPGWRLTMAILDACGRICLASRKRVFRDAGALHQERPPGRSYVTR